MRENFVFDRTLREILQGVPKRFIELLTGRSVKELLDPNFPKVEERQADFWVRLDDGNIFHLEVQTTDDKLMPFRMLRYYFLIRDLYGEPPFQMLLWLGDGICPIRDGIFEENLSFKYYIKEIRDIDCEILLESDDPNDNLLSILCRRKEGFWKRFYSKMIKLSENERLDYVRKVMYIIRLRRDAILELKEFIKEEKYMPIVIDVKNDPLFQEGYMEGMEEGIEKGIKKGIEKGIEKGIKKGILEGKEKGREEGEILGTKQSIITVLQSKFGNTENKLIDKINSINSKDKLMSILFDVVRCNSIIELEEKLKDML